jgi:hypothetical protein
VCLFIGLLLGTYDQVFLFCLTTAGFLKLRSVWICNLHLLLGLAGAVLSASSPADLTNVSFETPRIYIPKEKGGTVIPQGTEVPFRRLLGLAKSKLLYKWRSVSMSWYRASLWDLRPDITSCRSIAVWNLRSYFCEAPSLTRGRVCNLQYNHSMVWVAQNQ